MTVRSTNCISLPQGIVHNYLQRIIHAIRERDPTISVMQFPPTRVELEINGEIKCQILMRAISNEL